MRDFNVFRQGFEVAMKKFYEEKVMAHKKKLGQEIRYMLTVDSTFYPQVVYQLTKGITDEQIEEAIADFQKEFPAYKILLYKVQLQDYKPQKDKSTHQPRWITHPVKNPMKSTAQWLKDDEVTAVCNMCGCLGPTISKNSDGNSVLAKAGWVKEEEEDRGSWLFGLVGSVNPKYILRCPSCDEQVANKDTREDWF